MQNEPISNPEPLTYEKHTPDSFILKRGVPPMEFQPGVWLYVSSYQRGAPTAVIEVRPQQFEVVGEKQTVGLDQPLVIDGQRYPILALEFPADRGAWLEIATTPLP